MNLFAVIAQARRMGGGAGQGKWRDPESNRGHTDFQSVALPTELSRLMRYWSNEQWDCHRTSNGVLMYFLQG